MDYVNSVVERLHASENRLRTKRPHRAALTCESIDSVNPGALRVVG